jgi:WD40 repeat protein
VSSCVWAPDGLSFVTGVLEKTRSLCHWKANGDFMHDWKVGHRVQGLTLSPDGHRLIVMDNETHIYVYNFVTRDMEYKMDLKGLMGSVNISQNSRHLLVNKADGEARLLDLDTRETIRIFTVPNRTDRFCIRATLGGANESFVAAGSGGKTCHTD